MMMMMMVLPGIATGYVPISKGNQSHDTSSIFPKEIDCDDMDGHVLRKDNDDIMKKCATLEDEGGRKKGRRRKT